MKKVLFVFSQLDDADIDWMASVGSKQQMSRGDVLITEGGDIHSLFILLKGHVSVRARSSEIGRLGWGEILGEMSLVDRSPPSATVVADEDVQVLVIPRRQLEPKLSRDAPFAARFFRAMSIALADRLRNSNQRLVSGSDGADFDDELAPEVLDTLHLAGARFDRLLKSVMR